MIVLSEPGVDDDLSLFDCREPLRIENLSPKSAIEALIVAILPRAAGIDLIGLPAFHTQQMSNLTIAISAILLGQPDHL